MRTATNRSLNVFSHYVYYTSLISVIRSSTPVALLPSPAALPTCLDDDCTIRNSVRCFWPTRAIVVKEFRLAQLSPESVRLCTSV
jgi:hypothetical protein